MRSLVPARATAAVVLAAVATLGTAASASARQPDPTPSSSASTFRQLQQGQGTATTKTTDPKEAQQQQQTPREQATESTGVSQPGGQPPGEADDGGLFSLPVLLVALLVTAGFAGALVFSRRRAAPLAPAWPAPAEPGRPASATPHQHGDGHPVAPVAAAPSSSTATMPVHAPAPPAPAPLVDALRVVAADGPSTAIRQQVDRLLAGSPSRDSLVQAAVKYRDQLEGVDEGLRARLLAALHAVGVREVTAEGERLDGMRHEVLALEPAPSPELHEIVARTVRCGYVDGDRVLRVPTVVVYVDEAADSFPAE